MYKERQINFMYAVSKVLLLLTFIFAAGCGYRATARNHCNLGTQLCDNLFGEDTWENNNRLSAAEADIAELDKEITSMQSMIELLISELKDKSAQIIQLDALIQLIQISVVDNADFVNTVTADLQLEIEQLEDSVAYQQTIINDMIGDISELANQDSILEYVLPCGDRAGIYDETLLRTKSGKLIAYFESGSNRFLSELPPGTYSTTDQNPRCQFTVDSNFNIINAHR